MAEERTTEERDDKDFLYSENRTSDINDDSTQYESTDEEFLNKRSRPEKEDNKKKIIILSTLIVLLMFCIGLGGTLYLSKFKIYEIQGSSMEPTLSSGQSVIFKTPKTMKDGQIVVFNKPKNWNSGNKLEQLFIKRVTAKGGDTLMYDGTNLLVNNKVVFDFKEHDYQCKIKPFIKKLNKDEFFAMGDNYSVSLDSRRIMCDGDLNKSILNEKSVVAFGKIIMKL